MSGNAPKPVAVHRGAAFLGPSFLLLPLPLSCKGGWTFLGFCSMPMSRCTGLLPAAPGAPAVRYPLRVKQGTRRRSHFSIDTLRLRGMRRPFVDVVHDAIKLWEQRDRHMHCIGLCCVRQGDGALESCSPC